MLLGTSLVLLLLLLLLLPLLCLLQAFAGSERGLDIKVLSDSVAAGAAPGAVSAAPTPRPHPQHSQQLTIYKRGRLKRDI